MSEERLELLMRVVLTVGVIISAGLVAFGFGASFIVGWDGSLTGVQTVVTESTDFSVLLARLLVLQPLALVQAGLIVLIATPVVRVAVTLLGFWRQRDALYVILTFAVLGLLVISLSLVR